MTRKVAGTSNRGLLVSSHACDRLALVILTWYCNVEEKALPEDSLEYANIGTVIDDQDNTLHRNWEDTTYKYVFKYSGRPGGVATRIKHQEVESEDDDDVERSRPSKRAKIGTYESFRSRGKSYRFIVIGISRPNSSFAWPS